MGLDIRVFWMVHGTGPASHRHASKEAAVTEAERLARLHPGTVFVVLQAVEAVRKVDVERVRLTTDPRGRNVDLDDQIPF